jgi:hypothetical protein
MAAQAQASRGRCTGLLALGCHAADRAGVLRPQLDSSVDSHDSARNEPAGQAPALQGFGGDL